jgi:hypothetical protein
MCWSSLSHPIDHCSWYRRQHWSTSIYSHELCVRILWLCPINLRIIAIFYHYSLHFWIIITWILRLLLYFLIIWLVFYLLNLHFFLIFLLLNLLFLNLLLFFLLYLLQFHNLRFKFLLFTEMFAISLFVLIRRYLYFQVHPWRRNLWSLRIAHAPTLRTNALRIVLPTVLQVWINICQVNLWYHHWLNELVWVNWL